MSSILISNHNYDEYSIKILSLDQFCPKKAEKWSHYHDTESEASFSSFGNLRQLSPANESFLLEWLSVFWKPWKECSDASDQMANSCKDSDNMPLHLVKCNCETTPWCAKQTEAMLSGDAFMGLRCWGVADVPCFLRRFYIVMFSTTFAAVWQNNRI